MARQPTTATGGDMVQVPRQVLQNFKTATAELNRYASGRGGRPAGTAAKSATTGTRKSTTASAGGPQTGSGRMTRSTAGRKGGQATAGKQA